MIRKNEYNFWGLGAFIKSYMLNKLRNNFDLHIAVTGIEGSGKSAFAISLARYLDNTFMSEMDQRMYFSINNLDEYISILDENVKNTQVGELGGKAIIFDETQNIFNKRNAPAKENKALLEVIRTQRLAKMCCIYATPNVLELENFLSNRFDIILFCSSNKKDVYGVYESVNYGSENYQGSKNLIFQEMKKLDTRTLRMSPENLQNVLMNGNFVFDFKGESKFDKRLYERYAFLKSTQTSEFFNSTKEKINKNKPVKEEKKESRTQQRGLEIRPLSEMRENYEIRYLLNIENIMCEDDFIAQKVLARYLEITDSSLSKKIKSKGIQTISKVVEGKSNKFLKAKYINDIM